MDQQELERRLAEIFGPDQSKVSHGQETKEVDNPAFVPPGTPGYNPTIPPKVSITVETWTDANGSKLVAERWPDGTIKEGGRVTAPPKATAATTRTPEQQRADAATASTTEAQAQGEAEKNRERQWNSQHGYGWITHTERETAVRQQQAEARAQQSVERQAAATEAANQLNRDRLQFEKDKANLPQVKVDDVAVNGQHYTRVTSVTPQGTPTVANYGPNGQMVAEIPRETKADFAAEPEGAPPVNATPGQIATGLQAFSSWLSGQVKLWKDTGGKQGTSPEDATKLMDRRISVAEQVVKEQQNLASTQSGLRGQDITQRGQTLADTAGRRSTAESLFKTGIGLLGMAKDLGPGGAPLLNKAINDTLAAGRSYVDSFGGFKVSPEVGDPAFLAQLRQQSQQGIQTAAQGGPQVFQPRPVTGGLPAPDMAGMAAAEAQQQQAAAMPAPPPPPTAALPSPPDSGAVPAFVNPVNGGAITVPDTSLPPNRPDQTQVGGQIDNAIMPPAGPDPNLGQPGDPPYDPNAGSPVFSPIQGNVQQAATPPPPTDPTVGDPNYQQPQYPPPTYAVDPPIGMSGMPPAFMQQARYGQSWSPDVHGASLAQRLGMDPAIFQQAVQGLYG